MEETLRQFLIDYVSSKQTVNQEAIDDLNRITDEYINGGYSTLDRNKFFTKYELKFYLEVLDMNLQDENKHFFCLCYDKQWYNECLIDMIRRLSVRLMAHEYVKFLNSVEDEDED